MGGADILKVLNINNQNNIRYLDQDVINAYNAMPVVVGITVVLILVMAVILTLRRMGIRNLRLRGVVNELSNIEGLRERDRFIIRTNKILNTITNLVQNSMFRLAESSKDYYEYNIKRAGLMVPGGYRYLTAEEFNALIVCGAAILVLISFLVLLLFNTILGVVICVASLFAASSLPMLIIRLIVADKDREIRENFIDLYLMLHYVLMLGGGTPVEKILESYAKTTDSEEMKRFVANCIGYIDIHGEYNATKYIARDYREIPEVNKLMRLIRQLHDGGDIKQELIGFREELIKNKEYLIEKKMNRLVSRARMSFNLLMIILVQAIISAMSIYLPDLKLISHILGH